MKPQKWHLTVAWCWGNVCVMNLWPESFCSLRSSTASFAMWSSLLLTLPLMPSPLLRYEIYTKYHPFCKFCLVNCALGTWKKPQCTNKFIAKYFIFNHLGSLCSNALSLRLLFIFNLNETVKSTLVGVYNKVLGREKKEECHTLSYFSYYNVLVMWQKPQFFFLSVSWWPISNFVHPFEHLWGQHFQASKNT